MEDISKGSRVLSFPFLFINSGDPLCAYAVVTRTAE